jgi:hypothetical protein
MTRCVTMDYVTRMYYTIIYILRIKILNEFKSYELSYA